MKNIFFLLILFYFLQGEGLKIEYYTGINLYNFKNTKPMEIITANTFKGQSESETINLIQKYCFYKTPQLQGKINKYIPGAYKVTTFTEQETILIVEPINKFGIILFFKTINNQKLISKKIHLINEQIIDTVDYIYQDNKIYAASSGMHGTHYFSKPKTISEALSQFYSKFIKFIKLFLLRVM